MLKKGCLLALVFTATAFALDPHKSITQLVHTAWNGQDGAPSNVQALAQTADGYLWLGTTSGLFRFDGVRFTRFEAPPGEDFPDASIKVLLAARNGALWIATRSDHAYRLFSGHVTSYSVGASRIWGFAEAPGGALIAATDKGLRQFQDGTWKDIGKEWNFPATQAQQVFFDRSGTLWVVADNRVICRFPGQNRFVDLGEATSPLLATYQFAQGSGSAVWFADYER